MSILQTKMNWLKEQIDKRSMRERVLIFSALLIIIFAFWKAFIFDKIFGSQEAIAQNLQIMEKTIQQLQGQLTEVAKDIQSDPITKLRNQIRVVDVQNKRLEANLLELTKQLIPPVEMTRLLQDMIAERNGIQIIQVRNLPEEPLFTPEQLQSEETEIAKFQVYRHPLFIEFNADFHTTLAFIEALEALPWKMHWADLDYQVQQYPLAKVKLTIETLSLDRHWIGA